VQIKASGVLLKEKISAHPRIIISIVVINLLITWFWFAVLATWASVNLYDPSFGFRQIFTQIFTFAFGISTRSQEPALQVALSGLGTTLGLLVGTTVVTGLVFYGVIRCSHLTGRREQLLSLVGYGGSFPAVTWITIVVILVPSYDYFYVGWPVNVGIAIFALSIPLVAAATRAVVRGTSRRGFAFDGCLFTAWYFSDIVLVESVLGLDGVGSLLFSAQVPVDGGLVLATAAIILILAVIVGICREILWAHENSNGSVFPALDESGSSTSGAYSVRPIPWNRRWRLKTGVFVLTLIALSIGAYVVYFGRAYPERVPSLARAPFYQSLFWVLSEAARLVMYTGPVAIIAGLGIGLVNAYNEYGDWISSFSVGWMVNIPFLFWLIPGIISPYSARAYLQLFEVKGAITLGIGLGVVVGMAATHFIRTDDISRDALEPIVGITATAMGVLMLLTPLLLWISQGGIGLLQWLEIGELLAIYVAIGGLAIAFFLVGDDLRSNQSV
jgi:hypothetical protein